MRSFSLFRNLANPLDLHLRNHRRSPVKMLLMRNRHFRAPVALEKRQRHNLRARTSPPKGGESTPPRERADAGEDLLRRLERVFVRNNRTRRSTPFQTGCKQTSPENSDHSLPPPSSKAVNRRRFDTSVPAQPRYGPASLSSRPAPSSPTVAPDPAVVALAHGIAGRRHRREEALNEVAQLWTRLENPQATDSLIAESNIAEDVLVMIRRGERFSELAPRIGINQAAKRSRGFNQHQLTGFSAEQFTDAVKGYNLRVIHLRSVRPTLNAPAKKKRRTHMLRGHPVSLGLPADRLDWIILRPCIFAICRRGRFSSRRPFAKLFPCNARCLLIPSF